MCSGRLWVFNPGHEEAMRHQQKANYTASKTIRQMMHELAPLMQILSQEGDYIYQPDREGKTATLLDHRGRTVPEDAVPKALQLCPWAVERHIIEQVHAWALTRGLALKLPHISPAYTELSHRQSSQDLLNYLLRQAPHLIPNPDIIPTWCTGQAEDIKQTAEYYLSLGYKQLVLKRPYTSSGRGVEALDLPLKPRKYDSIIKQTEAYGSISLEPRLERVQDYAMLFYSGACGLDFVGYSKFETDTERGFAYSGNILCTDQEIETELRQALGTHEALEDLKYYIRTYLTERLDGTYEGYIGVDMMTYTDCHGQFRLHPGIEVNVRCTMGVLAHHLSRSLSLGQRAYFRIAYAQARELSALREQSNKISLLNSPKELAGFVAYIDYRSTI